MSDIVHAMGKVPVVMISVVLLMFFAVIIATSKEKNKDCFRFIKGIFVTVIISLVVFSSVAVLKYFSYLKLDIMQFGVVEVLFFGLVFGYVIFSRSLSEGKGVIPIKIPYPVKQVVLFFAVFAYLLKSDISFGMYWLVVAVMPFNIIYHLYYVKALDKIFTWIMKVSEKVDEKAGVNE